MSERVVIVIEYEAGPDVHLGLHEALTQIREGVDRLDRAANIKAVQIHVAIKDDADQVLAVFDKAEAAS
jgi:hypothetical protein